MTWQRRTRAWRASILFTVAVIIASGCGVAAIDLHLIASHNPADVVALGSVAIWIAFVSLAAFFAWSMWGTP